MRLSEFREAVRIEFGEAYGRVLTGELVVPDLGNRTPDDALIAGVPPKQVWLALCEATDVPPQRRHAAARLKAKG